MTTTTQSRVQKKHDQVRAFNYCAHAIMDLREFENKFRTMAPESARVLRHLIDMLHHSVKFILPNCCNLVAPEEFRQAHLDLVRLPYSCVAFEVPWEKEDGIGSVGGFEQTPATKRIALCWEAGPEDHILPGAFPKGGVFVVPIYWGPELKSWTVGIGGAFLPYENSLQEYNREESLPTTRIANEALIEAELMTTNGKRFNAEPFCLLPELYEQNVVKFGGDREKIDAQILIDSRDEAMVLIQACSVINCANVTTAEVLAPAALNKKRKKKDKQPFFSYKVLQLSEDRSKKRKDIANGSHASPRMHLRRGHLRRLKNKMVWVRPAMVNAQSKSGAVLKDYEVRR